MSSSIDIIVVGQPHGKMRPRFRVVNGHAMAYKPDADRTYETLIKNEAMASMKEAGWVADENPICVSVHIVQSIAKSVRKKDREEMLSGDSTKTSKPDIDNVVKIVLDALNGLVWKDDKQVVELYATKEYGEASHVLIHIWRPIRRRGAGRT